MSEPNEFSRLRELTPRQNEVLHFADQGKTNWTIGKNMGCAEGTVKKHFQGIFQRLGVETRLGAINIFRDRK